MSNYPNDPIILAGDINSWLRNPLDDPTLENCVGRFNLKDLLLHHHGPASEIPTRKDGQQIDYIFASKVIVDQTSQCGALHYDRMVDYDHQALFLDIDVDLLLGRRSPALASPALCGIDSTSAKDCKTYIKLLGKYLQDHKVYDRVEKL